MPSHLRGASNNPITKVGILALALVGALAACSDDDAGPQVSISPTAVTIAVGETQQFTVMLNGADVSSDATWESSNDSVATVSATGLATGRAEGTVTISATVSSQTVEASLKVTATERTLESIELTPANPSIAKGTSVDFMATGIYSDGSRDEVTNNASWSSSAPDVATVSNTGDGKGVAEGLKAGTTKITVGLDDKSAEATLTVTDAVLEALAVTPTTPSIAKSTKARFEAVGFFSDRTTQDLTSQVTWTSSNTDIATIESSGDNVGQATGVSEGSATIKAELQGKTGQTTLTVTAATIESLSITPTAASIPQGTTQTFAATGTFSDATTQDLSDQVEWASSNTSVATVSNVGLAQGVAVGDVTISADFGGKSDTASLTVTDATLESIAISPESPSVAQGSTQAFTATGTFSDATALNITDRVSWSSSNTDLATISNTAGSEGLAQATQEGSVTIAAELDGKSDTTTMTITGPVIKSITLTPFQPSLPLGSSLAFTATATLTDNNTQDVTDDAVWTSSAEAVASVSNGSRDRGLATALTEGTATIRAEFAGQYGEATLTVTDAAVASIVVTPAAPSVAKGTTQAFVATATLTDNTTQNVTAEATWSSSDTEVATISNAAGTQGVAHAEGSGAITITAQLGDVHGETTLTVTDAVPTALSITPVDAVLSINQRIQYHATATMSDGTTQVYTSQVVWSSSDDTVATIRNDAGDGVIKGGLIAHAIGTTTIKAVDPVSSLEATGQLEVIATALLRIYLTPSNPTVPKGQTQEFLAYGIYEDNRVQPVSPTWESSNTDVATIWAGPVWNAHAQALGVGSTTISATFEGARATATLTVSPAVLSDIEIAPANPSIPRGGTAKFKATGLFDDGSRRDLTEQVTWESSALSVSSISNASGSEGLAKGLNEGEATITCTYLGQSKSTTLTVTSAVLERLIIAPADPSVAKGTGMQFIATGVFSDETFGDLTREVTWTSSDENVALVSNADDSKGFAVTVGEGQSEITATLEGVTQKTTLTVTAALLTGISIEPTGPQLAVNTTLQLAAIGTYSDGTSQDLTTQVAWLSSTPEVATVLNDGTPGLVQGQAPGTTDISASFGGKTITSPLTVTPATVRSIKVSPANATIAVGMTQRFTATATFNDGTQQDITTLSIWRCVQTSGSGVSTVAALSNASGSEGTATGLETGSCIVTATAFEKVGGANLTVE